MVDIGIERKKESKGKLRQMMIVKENMDILKMKKI